MLTASAAYHLADLVVAGVQLFVEVARFEGLFSVELLGIHTPRVVRSPPMVCRRCRAWPAPSSSGMRHAARAFARPATHTCVVPARTGGGWNVMLP
jgi:hypothetical protein